MDDGPSIHAYLSHPHLFPRVPRENKKNKPKIKQTKKNPGSCPIFADLGSQATRLRHQRQKKKKKNRPSQFQFLCAPVFGNPRCRSRFRSRSRSLSRHLFLPDPSFPLPFLIMCRYVEFLRSWLVIFIRHGEGKKKRGGAPRLHRFHFPIHQYPGTDNEMGEEGRATGGI